MHNPKITVLITLYNQKKYICEAIESVLNQTFQDFELIIVDDKSTDGSLDIAKSYNDERIRIIESAENVGTYAAANIGLKEAKGEYVARLDSDDICFPERLKVQYDFATSNPEYKVVGCWVRFIDDESKDIGRGLSPETYEEVLTYSYFGSPVFHSAAFFHRDTIKLLGNYSEIRRAQDYRLWNTVLANGYKIYNIPKFLVGRRTHSENMTANYAPQQEEQATAILIEYVKRTLNLEISKKEVELLRKPFNYATFGKMSIIEKVQLIKFLKRYKHAFDEAFPDPVLRKSFENKVYWVMRRFAAKWWSKPVAKLIYLTS